CHLFGAQGIGSAVLDDLGMEGEGDSEDNKVSVRLNTCLGACSQAPVIMINHRLLGRASVESARSCISDLPSGVH
ncbi:MAG: NAD(P)H-dependent oxidoreductase subunit E, partial [Chloroflexi bacterium]|nr:NAD(P)H-dependent oxidoreductase subunit E [Chloroflexota bacterium]